MSIKKTQDEVAQIFEERGCQLVGEYINNKTPVQYKCKCGTIRKQVLRDFINRMCRKCSVKRNEDMVYETSNNNEEFIDTDSSTLECEKWVRVQGGWISSLGRAKNLRGDMLTLCPMKSRYRINKKHQYASRLVAEAFKIPDYDKLETQSYIVTHLDKNKFNNRVENLKIIHKKDIDRSGFRKRCLDKCVDVTGLEYKIIDMLPEHRIYENGEIFNGNRFLNFAKVEGYLQVYGIGGCDRSVKVHRLVCYAFHPIEGLNKLEDYKHLQVNHKDRNKSNNHKDNLEWVTQSENMIHSYRTKIG